MGSRMSHPALKLRQKVLECSYFTGTPSLETINAASLMSIFGNLHVGFTGSTSPLKQGVGRITAFLFHGGDAESEGGIQLLRCPALE
jgi:hypothetical protein